MINILQLINHRSNEIKVNVQHQEKDSIVAIFHRNKRQSSVRYMNVIYLQVLILNIYIYTVYIFFYPCS